MPYANRRRRLRKLIDYADAFLVTNETNVRYLTGFTGDSSFLLISSDGAAHIVSDSRYEIQIAEECPGLPALIRGPAESLMPFVCKQINQLGYASLIVEGSSMTLDMFEQLQSNTNAEGILTGNSEVEQLRMIKDTGEIKTIKRAVEIAERAFVSFRAQLIEKATERELAHELERLIRVLGGEGCSFDPIVASGPRSALPHAVPAHAKVGDSPLLLVDWGAVVDGYRSDLTRVLLTSRIPAKIGRAYDVVLEAQAAAIAAIRPGVAVAEVDQVARDVISAARMSKRFNHGLGHGIGLDIHELPRLGKNGEQILAEGMVVTVEPGVYFPGLGGIRIEDDVLITKNGAELLSTIPKTKAENQIRLLG